MARPTPASAAAIAITKNTTTSPAIKDNAFENVRNTRFTEFNMSSTAIKIKTAFLRTRTPTTPIENKMPASDKK